MEQLDLAIELTPYLIALKLVVPETSPAAKLILTIEPHGWECRSWDGPSTRVLRMKTRPNESPASKGAPV